MIVETTNSIYEVRREENRYRRIHEFGQPDPEFPVGQWFDFHRMSNPEVAESMQFWWLIAQSGRVSRVGFCETSPVVRVLPDDAASYVAARRRAAG